MARPMGGNLVGLSYACNYYRDTTTSTGKHSFATLLSNLSIAASPLPYRP